MGVEDVIQGIANLGYPIATAVALFWFMVKMVRELTDSVNNNTMVLTRIMDRLDRAEEKERGEGV